jgi:GNAT superfamily N-acetyltransferase
MTWEVREFNDGDRPAVSRLDTSFRTELIYVASVEGQTLRLGPIGLPQPREKRFPIDLDAGDWEQAYVVCEDGVVRGFVALSFELWNRRVSIHHFYVDAPHRRRGAGRLLMNAAVDWAPRAGALTLWSETSNLNYPGVEAYRGLGFELAGLDRTIYTGTPHADEFAVYLTRALRRGPVE